MYNELENIIRELNSSCNIREFRDRIIKLFKDTSPNKKGWECPRCHKINAPWASTCNCLKKETAKKKEEWAKYEYNIN